MDHIAYLDAKSNELEKLLSTEKTMIIRGAMGRKLPYGRVQKDDILFFINNNAERLIKAKGIVLNVINSDKMSKEKSIEFVKIHQDKLQLTDKQFQRWAGKRYIVLIEIKNVQEITHISFDKKNYSKMDDWLIIKKIENIKK